MGKWFFAYMLRCADGSYYAGHTEDLTKRITEHHQGGKCAYTSVRLPVHLVWSQDFPTREEAKAEEEKIKGWSRAKKEALARGDYGRISLLAKKKDWAAYRERRGKRTE